MSTSPAEQRKAERKEGRDDLVQYVEELAGPEEYPEGDAWMSLTDAARITRTSFISCMSITVHASFVCTSWYDRVCCMNTQISVCCRLAQLVNRS
jgi:hypothetical protein